MVSDALSGKWRLTKEQLKSFFSSAALSYRYVVLVPRRCLNLWQMVRDDVEKLTPGTRWITDIGMLSFVADVTKEYLLTGRFAPVLYIDDVLVHGQALNRRIRRYVNLVISSLEEQGISIIDSEDARQKLLDSIDIRVLFRNDDKLLMSRELSYRVSSQYMCSRSELQRQSLAITKFLADDSYIANTSYVVSAFCSPSDFEKDDTLAWQKFDVPYLKEVLPNADEGTQSDRLYFWISNSVSAYGCYPVVRSHHRQEVWQYTPYILHPSISVKHCDFILKTLFTLVSNKSAQQKLINQVDSNAGITELLDVLQMVSLDNSKLPAELKAHILEMLLAQVGFSCFLSEALTQADNIILYMDIDKIATNFGDVLSKEALIAFCRLDWDLSNLQELCSCFNQTEEFYFKAEAFNIKSHLSLDEMDKRFRAVFSEMLACGCLHNLLQEGNVMRSQHYAISPQEYGLFVSKDTLYYQDQRDYNLCKYLDDCSQRLQIRDQSDVQCMIAALFSLMDLGLFSLRLIITTAQISGTYNISQSMRHTEISLSALRYLLDPIWREIESIAIFCNEKDISIQRLLLPQMKELENQLKRFGTKEKPEWLLSEVIQALDSNKRLYPCVWRWN